MNYQCPVKQFAPKCFNFQEITKHKNVRSPPEHFAIGYVHNDNLPLRQYCIAICHCKQLQEGLMVFSDDFLHFLQIKIFFFRIHQNYLVALRCV